MVRRAISGISDDSQKENSGLMRSVNDQKPVKGEKGSSKGKAPPRRATAARIETGDEEEGQQNDEGHVGEANGAQIDDDVEEEEAPDVDASPKGRKRARLNEEGESRPGESSSQAAKKEKTRIETLPRDVDGFIPGSIVRIQLKNFVTYDFVEFRTGPYLNMIIGPNGTGKSTIACAICLGLNFPPNVLGRATELSSFVKQDADSAHIEIELKAPKGKPNLVIRRMLKKPKGSTFTLNGAGATGKEINVRMAELNVQVSNLCTFLPQDKVSEFARMSPQELLRETQLAAGNANLTSWHDTLIDAGKELKVLQAGLNADREQLKTMQDRNANLERDVKRYEERQALEQRIALLEMLLPYKQYAEAKERYVNLKKVQRALHRKVKKLQEKNAPLNERKDALERQMTQKDELREDMKSKSRRLFASMQKKWTDIDKLEGEADDLKNKLENSKNAEKERQKTIQKLTKNIETWQEELDNPPEVESMETINSELKRLNAAQRVIGQRFHDLQQKQKTNVEAVSLQKATIDREAAKLRQLDDVSHRKLEALARWDRDCADTVRWLRENRHRFKMEIFEPPTLSVTVPDRRYVSAVENCFSGDQMRTFVAQCEEDYALLNRLIVDTPEGLNRRARIHTWYRAPFPEQQSVPMTEAELHEVGFDGYAIDFVSCPEGLKWYLQAQVRLNRTAIALDPNRVDQNRAMEMAARVNGASYVVGHIFNIVTRSRYGKRLPQNSTRELRPARNLVHQDVDPEVKAAIDTAISNAREQLTLLEEEERALTEENHEIQADQRQYKADHEAIMERKKKITDAEKRLVSLRHKIDTSQKKLDGQRNAPSADTERTRLRKQLLSLAQRRANMIKEYARPMRETIKTQEEATRAALEYCQLSANKTALEAKCSQREEEYQRVLAEFLEADKQYEAAKEDSKVKLQVSKDKLSSCDAETREKFTHIEKTGEANERTAEEVELDLATQRHKLELSIHTSPGVVDTYKRRKAEIERLTETIEEKQSKADRIECSIKTARDNWQPALEVLVSSIGKKFSAAFDRLGCAGEIRIREHEDYDKWAIDILVKFRDHERLQLLTGERQSGGERSLTTILYLMSLTEEARAPFSLVDEINQGMDQRAERAVHNSLVDVTCKPDSGQYFLITPKLLPDLQYHERMKILCVNNGEWLPEELKVGSMMALIDGFVQSRSRTNASA